MICPKEAGICGLEAVEYSSQVLVHLHTARIRSVVRMWQAQQKLWAAQPPLEKFWPSGPGGGVIVAPTRKLWPSDQAGPPLTRLRLIDWWGQRNAITIDAGIDEAPHLLPPPSWRGDDPP